MKLSDKAFYEDKKASKEAEPQATECLSAEDLYDTITRLAQAGGPNMSVTTPQGPGGSDVSPMGQMPEPELRQKVQDLQSKGLENEEIIQHLTDMGAMGTNVINPDQLKKLTDVVMTASSGNQPDGTGADGDYAPLSDEEIDGTGKIAQADPPDELNVLKEAMKQWVGNKSQIDALTKQLESLKEQNKELVAVIEPLTTRIGSAIQEIDGALYEYSNYSRSNIAYAEVLKDILPTLNAEIQAKIEQLKQVHNNPVTIHQIKPPKQKKGQIDLSLVRALEGLADILESGAAILVRALPKSLAASRSAQQDWDDVEKSVFGEPTKKEPELEDVPFGAPAPTESTDTKHEQVEYKKTPEIEQLDAKIDSLKSQINKLTSKAKSLKGDEAKAARDQVKKLKQELSSIQNKANELKGIEITKKVVNPIDKLTEGKSVDELKQILQSYRAHADKLHAKWKAVFQEYNQAVNPASFAGGRHTMTHRVYKEVLSLLDNPQRISSPSTRAELLEIYGDPMFPNLLGIFPAHSNYIPYPSPEMDSILNALREKRSNTQVELKDLFQKIKTYGPAEVKSLSKQLNSVQNQLTYAGSIYMQLVKKLGQQMPKDELIEWLHSQTKPISSPMTMPPQEKVQPLSDEEAKNFMKDKSKKKSSNKVGQAGPPNMPPIMDDAAPGDDVDMSAPDMDAGPPESEDPRSLEEILDDLKGDMDVLTDKIQSGDAMLDGQEVEPVETDSGASPAPAPMVADKTAVDQDAKEYYRDYFGDYGDDLVEDKVAELIDLVDDVASTFGVKLTAAQTNKITDLLAIRPYTDLKDNDAFNGWCNKILVANIIKTGMYKSDWTPSSTLKRALNLTAYQALSSEAKSKHNEFIRLATDKMKQPKVKGQPDDAVDVPKLKDEADDEDAMLARPAHLPMKVDEQSMSGAYLKLTVKWDADHEAADRSSAGLQHAVLSFVKGLESQKEFKDIGFLGQISFDEFDPEAGLAVVSVRTQKPGDAPLKVDTSK